MCSTCESEKFEFLNLAAHRGHSDEETQMTMSELKAVVTQCETVAAVAKLAEAVRPAESATIRRPAGDTLGMSPYREVAVSFPTEAAAREFLVALEAAGRKLS